MATLQQILSININFRASTYIPKNKQDFLLQTLSEMLIEGFSLQQAVHFLQYLLPKQQQCLTLLMQHLVQGKSLESGLQQIGFSSAITSQLFYANQQGKLTEALDDCAKQLYEQAAFKKLLTKQLTYPVILMFFLIGLLFGMRTFLIPQLSSFITQDVYENQLLVRCLLLFFTFLPQIIIGSFSIILILCLTATLWLKKLPPIQRRKFLCHIWIIRHFIRLSCTRHLAHTLGHFLATGFSIQQTLHTLCQYPLDPLLTDIAITLTNGYLGGASLPEQLTSLGIFTSSFPEILHQAELTSQTAHKCLRYSETLSQTMTQDIQKLVKIIQPIMFLFIGILILIMYLMMMLPMLTIQDF